MSLANPVTYTAQDVDAGHDVTNMVLSLHDDTAWSRLSATRAAAAVTATNCRYYACHNKHIQCRC